MHLILNGINGRYLRDLTENATSKTEEVVAAVAYATDADLLFEWCWKNSLPLKFYGRLDADVAVTVPILEKFLSRESPNFVCRLVQHHHAKVIWWRGVGLYIGSANLTPSAWYKNVEAGCFFQEEEISDDMAQEVGALFSTLERHSTPLTDELLEVIKKRSRRLRKSPNEADEFWKSPSIKTWSGLVHTAPKTATERRRKDFLDEWHSTLQELRNIGERISRPENRPGWISSFAPAGAQADQFLHAHYYQRTFEGGKANYSAFFEKNKSHRAEALAEAIAWWRELPSAPNEEDYMLNVTAPFLRDVLSKQKIADMDVNAFREVCMAVHAIKDYSRRVSNRAVKLSEGSYTIPQKVDALSHRIWNDRSAGGFRVVELLTHVLYGGSNEELPERIWQAMSDPTWKIDGLGISAIGELVGWALPDRFPPRNGRTSKALRSLGYEVTVHVE